MAWALKYHDDAWADLERLSPTERHTVREYLATWVPDGPPDDPLRQHGSFEVFEHEISGVVVVYQITDYDDGSIVQVYRIRKKRPPTAP